MLTVVEVIFQDRQVQLKGTQIVALIVEYFFFVQIQFDGINDPCGAPFQEGPPCRALIFDFALVRPVACATFAVLMLVLMEEKPHGFRLLKLLYLFYNDRVPNKRNNKYFC